MIREIAAPDDIAVVTQLAREIWHEHFPRVISREQIDYMLGRFLSQGAISEQLDAGYCYCIIQDAGRDVGFFAVERQPDGRMHLSKLYIKKAYRGRGLGRMAFAEIEQMCRQQGCSVLWLRVNKRNALAIAVYKRIGFKTTETLVEDIGHGFVMDDYVMERTIE